MPFLRSFTKAEKKQVHPSYAYRDDDDVKKYLKRVDNSATGEAAGVDDEASENPLETVDVPRVG